MKINLDKDFKEHTTNTKLNWIDFIHQISAYTYGVFSMHDSSLVDDNDLDHGADF